MAELNLSGVKGFRASFYIFHTPFSNEFNVVSNFLFKIGVRPSNLKYFSFYSLTLSLEGNKTLFSKALHNFQFAQKVKFENRPPVNVMFAWNIK